LFDSDLLIGVGLPYWLPAGAAIRHVIEEYVRDLERRAGYQNVYSPVLRKRQLTAESAVVALPELGENGPTRQQSPEALTRGFDSTRVSTPG
jgi:hypothetical protein